MKHEATEGTRVRSGHPGGPLTPLVSHLLPGGVQPALHQLVPKTPECSALVGCRPVGELGEMLSLW